jgi:hypothetical protein
MCWAVGPIRVVIPPGGTGVTPRTIWFGAASIQAPHSLRPGGTGNSPPLTLFWQRVGAISPSVAQMRGTITRRPQRLNVLPTSSAVLVGEGLGVEVAIAGRVGLEVGVACWAILASRTTIDRKVVLLIACNEGPLSTPELAANNVIPSEKPVTERRRTNQSASFIFIVHFPHRKTSYPSSNYRCSTSKGAS